MSFEAVRWALAQDVGKSSTKFVLVAMADHVNAESQEWTCWPSYTALCAITHQNAKTVEAAVYRLKELGLIADTGERKGATGKVVVYRLNATKNGGVTPGPQPESANATRAQDTTKNGGVIDLGNPPKFPANPPKFDGQSPQISQPIPPKTGDGIRNGIRNGIGKESGLDAACAALPEVPRHLLADWLKVRKEKRAGEVSDSVAKGLRREAEKAGLAAEDAVRYCAEVGWQNFNAGFYAKREGTSLPHSGALLNPQERLEAQNDEIARRFLAKQGVH